MPRRRSNASGTEVKPSTRRHMLSKYSFLCVPFLPLPGHRGNIGPRYPYRARKLPRVFPNPSDASPNRASALLGSSFLGGVPLSPSRLLSARAAVAAGGARARYGRSWRAALRLPYPKFRYDRRWPVFFKLRERDKKSPSLLTRFREGDGRGLCKKF